jgi:hypothetical protein
MAKISHSNKTRKTAPSRSIAGTLSDTPAVAQALDLDNQAA